MKKVSKFTKVILAGMLVGLMSISMSFAQAGNGYGPGQGKGFRAQNGMRGMGAQCAMLNLTQEQQTQIDALRTKHMQETQSYRNQLGEKFAHLQTLRTAAKPDMKQINAELKSISELKLKMAESRESHIQDVRKILTDEQRVQFDARQGHRFGKANGKGFGTGRRGMGCRYQNWK